MNVKVGNNSLKNEMVYDVNLLLSSTNTAKQRSQSLRLSYTYRANALAMGYSYDANTGIRTYRAENVKWQLERSHIIQLRTAARQDEEIDIRLMDTCRICEQCGFNR